MKPDVAERFWNNVDRPAPSACWEWQGRRENGYGYFHYLGKTQGAHRVSLMLHGVEIPRGRHTDHICRNRACVNPLHLRIVTPRENTLAPGSLAPTAINASKRRCDRGHLLEGDNLLAGKLRLGWRVCKKCQRRIDREYRRRTRAQPPELLLTPAKLSKIRASTGSDYVVARKFGVNATIVQRIRRGDKRDAQPQ